MLRVAIQVKELISSNVTSVVDAASNPAKVLQRLQREIEESIIALERERTLTERRKSRLESQLAQIETTAKGWGEKAKTAMDHGREDLARQALMAREDCAASVTQTKEELATCASDLAEIDQVIKDLEAKREETQAQARAQIAAESVDAPAANTKIAPSKADAHLSRISELEKRTAFATEEQAGKREHASVDAEIEAMRRESKVDAELAAMKGGASKKRAPRKSAAKK